MGITTAIVSMNAVVSHCAALAVMFRSAMRRGRATPMIVSFRMTMNAETNRIVMTSRLRLLRRFFVERCLPGGGGECTLSRGRCGFGHQ